MAGSASEDDHPPFHLSVTDRQVLAQTDDEFHLHTWDDLKSIVGASIHSAVVPFLSLTSLAAENKLATLKRKPSDLVRYIEWTRQIKAAYGSITNFICQNRLHWTPLAMSPAAAGPQFVYKNPVPFADPDDYKILRNDWPYGLTPDITHLVVWLKTPIPIDSKTGDLDPESRRRIESFVRTTFVESLAQNWCAEDRVQWFKNWTQLQSVRGLEHVHVLVKDVAEEILAEWTGKGRPVC